MRIVLFLDLDDTVFQTRPKCPPGATVRPAAARRDGTPVSFMTDAQATLADVLFRSATVIPTTARDLAAFRRVTLPFGHAAILDFGGVVLLPGGELDRAWDADVRPRALAVGPELHEWRRTVEDLSAERGLGVTARVVSDFDMPLYLVVKHPLGDAARLGLVRDRLRESADRGRFFLHENGNNLSLVPRFLGKERAVRHVLDHRLGPDPVVTIGLGDSLTDAPFLDLCDYSLVPRGSQLARRRVVRPEDL